VQRQQKSGRKEQRALAKSLLETVGLADTGKLMPSELSGGMRKRVGLARALASEPQILLYDEPTSGLDPVTAYAIDGLIKEIDDRTHATSVVVTHDLKSTLRIADRVIFLSKGKILVDAPPKELMESKEADIRELIQAAEADNLKVNA
jgi:phospholipid/cholesterol/gamma-HCH transport system ATP-binding protein